MAASGRKRSLFDLVECRETETAVAQQDINNDSLYSHLACTHLLDRHVGCVNALDWNEEGTMLASGSDDRHIALWRFDANAEETHEGGDVRTMSTSVYHDTGCRGNIFGVKFLPSGSNKLVAVSADASVRFLQVREDGSLATLARAEDNSGRVLKVDIDPSTPHWFITASEDGTLREYDVRSDSLESGHIVATWAHEDVSLHSVSVSALRPELVASCGYGPIARVIDRRRPKTLTFQRHSTSSEAIFTWMPAGINLHSDLATAVKFSRHSMDLLTSFINDSIYRINYEGVLTGQLEVGRTQYLEHEADSYRELAGLWAEAVKAAATGTPSVPPRTSSSSDDADWEGSVATASSEGVEDGWDDRAERSELSPIDVVWWQAWIQSSLSEGHPFREYVKKLSWVISTQRRMQFELDPVLGNIHGYNCHNLILASLRCRGVRHMDPLASNLFLNHLRADDNCAFARQLRSVGLLVSEDPTLARIATSSAVDRLSLDQALQLQPIDVLQTEEWRILEQQSRVCTGYHQRYTHHINEETVKDVGFVGPHHEYVTSGSDGGVFLIWSREGRPLFIGRSDNHVVNCVIENPRMPVIAVSGIDSTIKLWEPTDPSNVVAAANRWRALSLESWERLKAAHSATIAAGSISVACPVQ